MIPRIQTGDSFRGAALYYLHDKRLEGEQERLTTERVSWTHTLNTLENEPEAVIREMQHTAMNQQLLKYLSGNRGDGRPTERTVMTVAMAWSPEQSPDREQMIAAGESYLKHMGWQDHQVLFVAHNDTKHPHVHLIINRIHPDTGMTMDSNWSKTRSQKWALAYEREHGHIYCHAREAKYGRDQEHYASHLSYREWRMWQEISRDGAVDPEFHEALKAGEWDALKGNQRDSRIAYWKETGRMRNQLRSALREDVRTEFAPEWKAYSLEKEERDKKTNLYDREARRAIRHLRKQGGTQRTSVEIVKGPDGRTYRKRRGIESDGIEQIKKRKQAYHARQREELWEMRSAIAARQKERLGALVDVALERLGADRANAFSHLLGEQRGDKKELRKDQRAGERRYDTLQGKEAGPQPTPLTPEQITGYVAQARAVTARNSEFERTNREVTVADRAVSKEPERDPLRAKPEAEKADRAAEKRDKDQLQEAKRREGVEWYLAKRAHDRDRGGGRDR
jgi:hypothetical protein